MKEKRGEDEERGEGSKEEEGKRREIREKFVNQNLRFLLRRL